MIGPHIYKYVKQILPRSRLGSQFGTGELSERRLMVSNMKSHFPTEKMVYFASENSICYLALNADWHDPEFDKDSDPHKAGKTMPQLKPNMR